MINYTEEAVRRIMPGVLNEYAKSNPGTCTCSICQDDILALTLNELPPHYAASLAGEIFTEVGLEQIGGKAQIVSVIINTIKRVSDKPRHK
ncbi:MAG: late competence development ComFB family protein [Eubacteriales bacterium]|jgi:competence protein ComFB